MIAIANLLNIYCPGGSNINKYIFHKAIKNKKCFYPYTKKDKMFGEILQRIVLRMLEPETAKDKKIRSKRKAVDKLRKLMKELEQDCINSNGNSIESTTNAWVKEIENMI